MNALKKIFPSHIFNIYIDLDTNFITNIKNNKKLHNVSILINYSPLDALFLFRARLRNYYFLFSNNNFIFYSNFWQIDSVADDGFLWVLAWGNKIRIWIKMSWILWKKFLKSIRSNRVWQVSGASGEIKKNS